MRRPVEIEDIEALRLQQGIDDVELREAIRGLRVGDSVKLTFLTTSAFGGETLLVRITSIRSPSFRGKLTARPSSAALAHLQVGSPIAFTVAHIHSVPKVRRACQRHTTSTDPKGTS